MESENIEIEHDGQSIIGIITDRQKFRLEVTITHPYVGWSEYLVIPSMAMPGPRHFLTAHGDEVARNLLLTCFLKLQELDNRWPAIVAMRNELRRALKEVKSGCTSGTINTVAGVINEYWGGFVFLDNEELVLSVGQEFPLDLMIEVYNNTGKQLFKK